MNHFHQSGLLSWEQKSFVPVSSLYLIIHEAAKCSWDEVLVNNLEVW